MFIEYRHECELVIGLISLKWIINIRTVGGRIVVITAEANVDEKRKSRGRFSQREEGLFHEHPSCNNISTSIEFSQLTN